MTARLLLVLLLGGLPGLAAAQGLGGAAREEAQRRERREAGDRKTQAYTNDDLPSEAMGPEDEGEAEEAAPVNGEGPGVAATDDAESLRERLDRATARRAAEEKKWRARAAAARAAVEAARAEHEIVCRTGGFFVGGG